MIKLKSLVNKFEMTQIFKMDTMQLASHKDKWSMDRLSLAGSIWIIESRAWSSEKDLNSCEE